MISESVWTIAPLLCLAGGAFLIYLLGRFVTRRNEILALGTAFIFGLALALHGWLGVQVAQTSTAAGLLWGNSAPGGILLAATPDTILIGGIGLVIGLCCAIYSGRYLALDQRYSTYYPLLLLLLCGLLGMIQSTDLFNLYLFCELMSIAAYVLVAFRRSTDTSIEAGFKYLILGSVGTLMMVMGVALIYRQTGSVALQQPTTMDGAWGRVGLACWWVGLATKSALVPLHSWLPDAYGRAPSSVSAVLAAIVSKSTLYMLPKVCLGLGMPAGDLGLILIWLSFLNMTLGNVLALMQTNTKRLLAYSSVAQTGYILFGLGVGLRYGIPSAIQAAFFILLTHAVLKATAFLSKGVCHFYLGTTTLEELRGTAAQLPLIATTFSLSLIGLAGIPPLAGFVSKWFLLTETLRAGEALAYGGVAIFLLNTLLSLGYYLPVLARLFAPAENPAALPIRISRWMAIPLLMLSALIVGIGVLPQPWWTLVAWAMR